MRKQTQKVLSTALAAVLAVTTAVIPAAKNVKAEDSAAPAAEAPAGDAEAVTAYNGYMAFQLGGYWVSRADYMDESAGLSVTEYVNADHKSYGSAPFDYHSMVVASNPKLGAKNDKTASQYLEKVSISDPVMKENGSYEAVIDGLDVTQWEDMGNAAWNMLFISTDIPLTMKGVTCKDMTVYIDDKEFVHLEKAPHNTEASTNHGVYQFFAFDTYGETHGTTKGGAVQPMKDGAPDKTYAVFPKKSIRITYTIEGVDFTSGKQSVAQPAGPVVGAAFSGTDGFKYSVTTRAKDDGTKGKVKLTGLTAKGKKKSSITIPATVSYNGCTYKVKNLKSGVFAKNKKIKKVTLSNVITSIPSKAFQNCTKLSKISVKSKVKVSKNAFKGCKKTIKISGSKANKKYFKEQVQKSGYKKVK